MVKKREVSFKVDKWAQELIDSIVDRAMAMHQQYNGRTLDKLSLHMDITACHANGNPLDLKKLLGADDFTFAHDVYGIMNHINRENGRLERCFLPRCSA